MKIEILYFDGCPNHLPAVERINEVLKEEGIAAEIAEVKVEDETAARAIGFLGSPSIRVDGCDVEAAARSSKDFGMMCRTYLEGRNRVGLPSREMIRAAIREAMQAQPLHNCCQPQTALAQPASVEPKRNWFLGASIAAAVVASLCCILPILTALTGIGVLAAGAKFEHLRPYFLGATGLLLVGGFLLAFRDYKRACKPGSVCATKPLSRWNFIALGTVAALVVGVAAFPYYSGAVARVVVGKSVPSGTVGAASLTTVTFRIPDMDCPACAVSLSATFQKLPGVRDAKLDVSSRQAIVTYDPGAQSIAALEKVISDAGFHVASASRS
jgi:copper chaperone CopZ